jgi:hypothetical protein
MSLGEGRRRHVSEGAQVVRYHPALSCLRTHGWLSVVVGVAFDRAEHVEQPVSSYSVGSTKAPSARGFQMPSSISSTLR